MTSVQSQIKGVHKSTALSHSDTMSSPLALCWMASIEGMRPLNMSSFRWPHMDQSMEKGRCHSVDNRCVPALKDLQKASQDEISSRSTLARCQTDEAIWQVMNRCSQVSSAPAQSGQPAGTSDITRCRNALVFRRLRRRSQANM